MRPGSELEQGDAPSPNRDPCRLLLCDPAPSPGFCHSAGGLRSALRGGQPAGLGEWGAVKEMKPACSSRPG